MSHYFVSTHFHVRSHIPSPKPERADLMLARPALRAALAAALRLRLAERLAHELVAHRALAEALERGVRRVHTLLRGGEPLERRRATLTGPRLAALATFHG